MEVAGQTRRVALVTGGLGAIGSATCKALTDTGFRVVAGDLVDSRPSDSTDMVVELDIRSVASCEAAIDQAVSEYGRLDVLINNAGINARGLAEDMPEDIWRDLVDVNLNGTFRMCQAAFPALRDTGGAAIVNLSSSAGLVAIGGSAMYGVTKAAITHLTKILALEWAPHDIRVNAVAPTLVPSDMTVDLLQDEGYLAKKIESIPLGRVATLHDVVSALSWLISPAAAMTTGHTLPVDGGVNIL